MRSTFMGLETNKRGLYTQQSALYTTGHNISNANTLGYSRQRVNMEATSGFPGVGLNTGTMPGFLGTGVQAGSIQRVRDSFVDHQFRQESNKFGYWESRSKSISQMEDVLTEPSDYGLQKSLSEFWKSLQDLGTDPENGGARAVAVEKGMAVAESFNYMHKSLTEIQTNLGTEIDVSSKNINSILEQIANLNRQITDVEPNGYLPNDLYDKRDALLDELATYIPIEISYEKTGGRALAIAEGAVTINLKTTSGTVELVKGESFAKFETEPNSLVGDEKGNLPIEGLTIVTASGVPVTLDHDDLLNTGELKSLMNAYGVADGSAEGQGLYPDMLAELNKLAAALANEMNKIHSEGTDLEGNRGGKFFDTTDGEPFTAGNLTMNKDLLANPSLLAASDSTPGNAEEGNGKNALRLSKVQSSLLADLGGATVDTYFQGVIGKLGVDGEQAEKLAFNTVTLLGAVEHRRASISSVSLDEEMTDMIRFQQAYNASARMITVVDETLDKIINGMGVAGR